jgi:hypothetical protein
MNELHFEHLQRVTAAIGRFSAESVLSWDTEPSFWKSLSYETQTNVGYEFRKLSTLTGRENELGKISELA